MCPKPVGHGSIKDWFNEGYEGLVGLAQGRVTQLLLLSLGRKKEEQKC